jgi:cell division protein FtsI/penicillin-binding protein 2
MHQYLESFGIGKLTGIDLQGEMTPPLKEKLTYVDVATISFGQGLATTPIQLISAITTIARDGIPITPQVVDKLALDDWEKDIKPKEGKRVISPKTAEEITQMMIKAAEKGEAQWTALRDFQIAGKTGTAQIPVEGHYDEEKTIASFVGFAPANDPAFVMLVTLKEPQSSPWASETAAPLWFDIAKDLFSHFSIQPKK